MDGALDFARAVLDRAGALGVAGLALLGWFGGMAWYRPETLERWALAIDARIGDQWPLVILSLALAWCWWGGERRNRARDQALAKWFSDNAEATAHLSHALTSIEQTVGACGAVQQQTRRAPPDPPERDA